VPDIALTLPAKPVVVLELNATSALGGGPKIMLDLVRGLHRDRFAPVVIAPDDGPYYARFRDLAVPVVDVALRSYSPAALRTVVATVRRHRVDVIHSHGKGAGLYGRLAAALTRTPAVHTFHGLHYRAYGLLKRAAYLRTERLLARFTRCFVHVSRSELDDAVRLRVSDPARAIVVWNGLDCAELDQVPSNRARVLAALGLRADVVVGTVARLSPQKGLDDFVRAARLVADRFPGVGFALIGDAPAGDERIRDRLHSLVAELGLREQLVMPGYRNDAVALMKAFDVYASSSLWEGAPVTLLEAMACRIPVVATDVGGNNEAVVDGVTGLLVPVQSPEALARRTCELLADASRRRRLGEAGRQRVEAQFSLERMVRDTERAYEVVAAGRFTSRNMKRDAA
jgi:glycosyltransferase involved in cell wall biosynthesis